ncbi:MAG: hypothetical protein IPM84_12740, partial [Anaerolineae bacterium]|nr:hypothetical protein [Anaerolineae bacterium]
DVSRQNSAGATAWNWTSSISGNSFTSTFTSGYATGNYGIRVSWKMAEPIWSSWLNIGRDVTAPRRPAGLTLVCNANGSAGSCNESTLYLHLELPVLHPRRLVVRFSPPQITVAAAQPRLAGGATELHGALAYLLNL